MSFLGRGRFSAAKVVAFFGQPPLLAERRAVAGRGPLCGGEERKSQVGAKRFVN